MQAVEACNHEKAGTELRRAHGIAPGAHAFMDQLGPFKRLHADKGRAEQGGEQHQHGGLAFVAAIAKVDRHRHRPAGTDEDERHDRNQYQRNILPCDGEGKYFRCIRPGLHGRCPHRHVTCQETGKDEGIRQQENPHHRLAPMGMAEDFLIGRPVSDDLPQGGSDDLLVSTVGHRVSHGD